MQRASETIGALAAALATAQTELINPEKSLAATAGLIKRGVQSLRERLTHQHPGEL